MRFFRKKPEPADPFAAFTKTYGVRVPRAERPEPEDAPTEPEPEAKPAPEPPPKPVPWAHRTLGVDLGATPREISAAYRRLARMHHPDVAGDEDRMKEINIAYAELRR